MLFVYVLQLPNELIMTSQANKSAPKKQSWALMAIEEEYEEEQERLREEDEKTKKITEKRRYLLSIGEYQLEEGEILE